MTQQHKQFVFRTYSRLPIHTLMIFMGKDFAGHGMVRELSRLGCCILGNYPVTRGETLSLRISHPTRLDPLCIESATVRWVNGPEFGVAFGHLGEREADQLQRMVDELLGSESASGLPARSPNDEARLDGPCEPQLSSVWRARHRRVHRSGS